MIIYIYTLYIYRHYIIYISMDFERQHLDLNLNTRPSWVVVDGWFPPSLGPNATIFWACV